MDTVSTLRRVSLTRKSWAEYADYADLELRSEIYQLARELQGCRVVQVNATPAGGGVAEMLASLVPVLRSLGLDAEWFTLPPDEDFFAVTKGLHNAMQGGSEQLSPSDWDIYFGTLERVAAGMRGMRADVWVLHDPQPLPLIDLTPLRCRTLWRCHIDCSSPQPSVQTVLLPWMQSFDRIVFSQSAFCLKGLHPNQTALEFPAIDPLATKNRKMGLLVAREILSRLGIDTNRPLVTQVSRFDPWKNPWQAVDAYRLAKQALPGLQLALVGVFSASDDPEGPRIYESVRQYAANDPDVHLFVDPLQVGDVEINAFQTASHVVLQRSTREGFGLVVTEAMWKARPVVGTPVGGIAAQIIDGESGVLVDSAEACGAWIVRLLREPDLAEQMGQSAQARVRAEFLLPRLLRDELALYAGAGTAAQPGA